MRILRVEVIVGAIQIGGHGRYSIPGILDPICLTHLDASDLGDGVPLVGWLEGGGEKSGFRDGLRSELRVDAGRAEEDELDHGSTAVGGVDDVGLDLEVSSDEIDGEGGVGMDASNLGGTEDHVLRAVFEEEGLYFRLTGEIELGM